MAVTPVAYVSNFPVINNRSDGVCSEPKRRSPWARKSQNLQREVFVDLLQEQIDTLRGGEYEYEYLDIYTAGADVPWRFGYEDELFIHAEQGILVARDGPSNEEGNEDVPEYVIRLGRYRRQSTCVAEAQPMDLLELIRPHPYPRDLDHIAREFAPQWTTPAAALPPCDTACYWEA